MFNRSVGEPSAATASKLIRIAAAETVGEKDARLLEGLRRRDRKASAELIHVYADPLHSYLQRRLYPRTELADDILQEVFLAALDALPKATNVSALRPWLFGIARHKVEDHYRRVLRTPEHVTDDSLETTLVLEPGFDELIDEERIYDRVHRALSSLPEEYSAALLWRYWEKRSAAEMAEQTGKSVKAIERLLARARARFKRRWHEEAE